ncbi:hypothetical protein K1W54_09170 [Micromonospora sp. CPCC 205371]|nr:hypothetical protein [Micromonospora sp. CPCC 205371]
MADYMIDLGPLEPISTDALVEDLGKVFGVPFRGHPTPGAYSAGTELFHLNLDLDTDAVQEPKGDYDRDHPYHLEVEPRRWEKLTIAKEVFRTLQESGRYRVVLYENYVVIESTHYRPEDIP